MTGRALLLVALVLALGAAHAAAQPTQVRVLVVKLTWGPQPYSQAEVDASMQAVEEFFATGSFGKVAMTHAQTPWTTALPAELPKCGTDGDAPGVISAATAAAGDAAYDRLVVLLPAGSGCGAAGFATNGDTVVADTDDAAILAHELGHTFGMGHAGAISCQYGASGQRGFCRSDPYGDGWDVMGGATLGDFGALQKADAGWLVPTYLDEAGLYRLAPLEEPSAVPQALVVRTGGFEYWIDHREALGNDARLAGRDAVVTGFEVHRIPVDAPELTPDYLLPIGRHNRYYVPPGATFAVPHVFAIGAVARANGVMTVRFRRLRGS
jgi:hypothetical protein